MFKPKRSAKLCIIGVLLAAMLVAPNQALATNKTQYLGKAVEAGLDTGFTESNHFTKDDPHFGWKLGRFYISGYTGELKEDGKSYTVLKNVGDKVTLRFKLTQDIDKLNNNPALTIADDTNGYDERFEVPTPKTGFGRGTLIIRQTDSQGKDNELIIYNDYLTSATTGADNEVHLFEEGDYEVALDYEIKEDRSLFKRIPLPAKYHDYTMRFKFRVRNGNAMVFPYDLNGKELTNQEHTENGFTIKLAESKYLKTIVQREELVNNGGEYFWDIRENKPAEENKQYTLPGRYTIEATNESTGETVEKILYVGDDPTLKCIAVDGVTLEELEKAITKDHAYVDEKGHLVYPSVSNQPAPEKEPESSNPISSDKADTPILLPFIAGGALIAAIAYSLVKIRGVKKSNDQRVAAEVAGAKKLAEQRTGKTIAQLNEASNNPDNSTEDPNAGLNE